MRATIRAAAVGQRRVVVFVTLVAAVFVLFFPARQLLSQRDRIGSLEERRDALRAENDRLAGEVSRLSDPAELEALARDRLGLVRPGERAYFVEPSGAPQEAPQRVSEEPPVWSRVWTWLSSLVRGRN